MRYLIPIAVLLALSACESWNWRDAGRSFLESACNSFGNCGVPCAPGEEPGWCQ